MRRPIFVGARMPMESLDEYLKRAVTTVEEWSYEGEPDDAYHLFDSGSFTAVATQDIIVNLNLYRRLELHLNGIRPATDAVTLRVYFSSDAGANWTSGNIVTNDLAGPSDYIQLGTATIGNAAGEGYWGIVTIGNWNVAGQKPIKASGLLKNPAGATVTEEVQGYDEASVIGNALRIQFSSGNIAAVGTYNLYATPN